MADDDLKCDGHCLEHKGTIAFVHVYNPIDQYDWGNFHYCDTAITQDRSSGLVVEIVKEIKNVK